MSSIPFSCSVLQTLLMQFQVCDTVKPLYNGHLGDRRKWPLQRDGRCKEVQTRVNLWTIRPQKMAVVERWPLGEVRV